jgi:hypothetical protein
VGYGKPENDLDLGGSELHLSESEGGIADALGLAEDVADGESICLVLGDYAKYYENRDSSPHGIVPLATK